MGKGNVYNFQTQPQYEDSGGGDPTKPEILENKTLVISPEKNHIIAEDICANKRILSFNEEEGSVDYLDFIEDENYIDFIDFDL